MFEFTVEMFTFADVLEARSERLPTRTNGAKLAKVKLAAENAEFQFKTQQTLFRERFCYSEVSVSESHPRGYRDHLYNTNT